MVKVITQEYWNKEDLTLADVNLHNVENDQKCSLYKK